MSSEMATILPPSPRLPSIDVVRREAVKGEISVIPPVDLTMLTNDYRLTVRQLKSTGGPPKIGLDHICDGQPLECMSWFLAVPALVRYSLYISPLGGKYFDDVYAPEAANLLLEAPSDILEEVLFVLELLFGICTDCMEGLVALVGPEVRELKCGLAVRRVLSTCLQVRLIATSLAQ